MAFNRYRWRLYGFKLRTIVPSASVFGLVVGGLAVKPWLLGAAMGTVSATVDILVVSALISGAETFLPGTRLGRALARAPFLAAVAVKSVAYSLVIGAVIGGRLGPHVASSLVDATTAQSVMAQLDAFMPTRSAVAMMAVIVILMIMLRQAVQLIGERTMIDILRGRYRRPRLEERFFLFLDVVGSTPVAERLGPVAVHGYLNKVFGLASDPIDQHDGNVVHYVGDEVVVTWSLSEGRTAARPLACLFAIDAALTAAAADFEREFGAIPRLRAALHAGEVVTGETGGTRRAIVFRGDVMNTTSRIENATRALGRSYLVSADALERMDGVDAYAWEDLGPQQLRGKEARLRVYAVTVKR